jgi:hypothetical protein
MARRGSGACEHTRMRPEGRWRGGGTGCANRQRRVFAATADIISLQRARTRTQTASGSVPAAGGARGGGAACTRRTRARAKRPRAPRTNLKAEASFSSMADASLFSMVGVVSAGRARHARYMACRTCTCAVRPSPPLPILPTHPPSLSLCQRRGPQRQASPRPLVPVLNPAAQAVRLVLPPLRGARGGCRLGQALARGLCGGRGRRGRSERGAAGRALQLPGGHPPAQA